MIQTRRVRHRPANLIRWHPVATIGIEAVSLVVDRSLLLLYSYAV